MIAVLCLLAIPFRIVLWLGVRGTITVVCLFVLTVTGYGVAEDLGLLDVRPAIAAPHRKPSSPSRPVAGPAPSSAARAEIPRRYLALYRQAGARYRLPWPVLAGIGKVESDHGRDPGPGVRSGANFAGACGPMQIGCVTGSAAGNSWATYGRGSVYDPADAIPAAARYLLDHGARRDLDGAIYGYNHSPAYVAAVRAHARRYAERR